MAFMLPTDPVLLREVLDEIVTRSVTTLAALKSPVQIYTDEELYPYKPEWETIKYEPPNTRFAKRRVSFDTIEKEVGEIF